MRSSVKGSGQEAKRFGNILNDVKPSEQKSELHVLSKKMKEIPNPQYTD